MCYISFTFNKEVKNQLDKLKEIREKKGLTITELSRLSKVTRQTIYRLENEEDGVVNSKTLKALADALGVGIADFFEPSM